ncbi:MAG: hypothetical protein JO155_14030, partial [Acidimicrobiia bacterium]|nr:hypothetical protein [Acidimicrobiia bacterium]
LDTPDGRRAEADKLIAYHAEISGAMTAERTALESRLIPVSAYILVSAAEAWYRWPDMMQSIDKVMPAEEIGAAGRRPGVRVNAVHLWSIANIYLTGRKLLTTFGVVEDEVERTWTVLDFWRRAAGAYRADGTLQAWDAGFKAHPYGDGVIESLLAQTTATDEQARAAIKKLNATLVAYLFLMYFDTRVGAGDSGPYPLDGGRTLLVRDYYQLGQSDFAWSHVAAGVPYQNLTAALVLDGVDVRVNDWGTSLTEPEDYLDHLVAFGLYTTDGAGGALRPVLPDEWDGLLATVRKAQADHYRQVAAMDRRQKIDAGAYVYFSFLRPFAEVAGIADELDWTVPRDTVGPLYDALEPFTGEGASVEETGPYYLPLAPSA